MRLGVSNLPARASARTLDDPEFVAYMDGLDAALAEAERLGEVHGPRGAGPLCRALSEAWG
jgi:hypothetical protein